MVSTAEIQIPPQSYASSAAAKPYLLLEQSGNRFGIELAALREVIPLVDPPITPVPNTLPLVMGVFNLRGEILAVVDFGDLIQEEPTSRQTPQSRIIVLEIPQPKRSTEAPVRFGLAVAGVGGVVSLQVDRIYSAAEMGSILTPFLQGLYTWREQLLMLLDVRALADVLGSSST